ncbi:protein of unknown function (plasmid) [Caballeronia sp. S22]
MSKIRILTSNREIFETTTLLPFTHTDGLFTQELSA